ncbi:hypothetical protein UlMin_038919 [Ulmus minor]
MEGLKSRVSRVAEGLILFIFILVQSTSAQEGFVSIACCAEANYKDQSTNISWTADYNWFPDKRSCQKISRAATNYTGYGEVRIFDIDNSGKRCYSLDTTKGEDYLIRGTFLYYGEKSSFFISIGVTQIGLVNSPQDLVVEGIFRATKNNIDFCLVKKEASPYISELVLRPLQDLDYLKKFSSSVLKLVGRFNLGSKEGDIRYPTDPSDRIWKPVSTLGPKNNATQWSGGNFNFSANVEVPSEVLKTALTDPNLLEFIQNDIDAGDFLYCVILYFFEVEPEVLRGQRIFDIYLNNERNISAFDISSDGDKSKRLTFDIKASGSLNVTLSKASGSLFGPICNAYEILQVFPSGQETILNDLDAITEVKHQLLDNNKQNEVLQGWSGDPCLPAPWEGLVCDSTVITKLDLSSSNLVGPLPQSIIKLNNLTALNLSDNGFTGEIPSFPPSSMLETMDLRNNDLEGPIPGSLALLPHFERLYISCNPSIVKDRPSSFNGLKVDTTSGPCRHVQGPASSKRIIIIGSVACASLVLTVVIGIFVICLYKQKVTPIFKGKGFKGPGMQKNLIFSIPSLDEIVPKSISIQTFTLPNIKAATQNYKTLIGEGGFGSVYRGTLPDGQEVAVKVRSATSAQGTREFENEQNLLSTIWHENLVPLLGYCSENDQQILVYPFMSNGSLQDRLYGTFQIDSSSVFSVLILITDQKHRLVTGEAAKRRILDWPTRLSIALGAARGLMHLHSYGRGVIHRDVKSSNILLDQSMTAKVADFGFSKYAPQEGDSFASLEVRGTAGYLDPEYYTTHHLSDKSDVFSFGVVLFEIVSGREPLNIHRPRNEWSLVEWSKQYVREQKIDEIVDPSIKGGYHAEAMWRVVETAMLCIEPFSANRPSMADIVRELEDALIIENNASEYMRSIESFSGSIIMERKIAALPSTPTPTEASPILTQNLAPPEPR